MSQDIGKCCNLGDIPRERKLMKVKEIVVNEIFVNLDNYSQISIKRRGDIYPKDLYERLSEEDKKLVEQKVQEYFHS